MTSIAALQARERAPVPFAEPSLEPVCRWMLLVHLLSMVAPPPKVKGPMPWRIIDVVADQYGMTSMQLRSKRRTADVAHPRQLAMWLMRRHTVLSSTEVGQIFSRDHTTVLHAQRAVDRRWTKDEHFRAIVTHIEGRLGL